MIKAIPSIPNLEPITLSKSSKGNNILFQIIRNLQVIRKNDFDDDILSPNIQTSNKIINVGQIIRNTKQETIL